MDTIITIGTILGYNVIAILVARVLLRKRMSRIRIIYFCSNHVSYGKNPDLSEDSSKLKNYYSIHYCQVCEKYKEELFRVKRTSIGSIRERNERDHYLSYIYSIFWPVIVIMYIAHWYFVLICRLVIKFVGASSLSQVEKNFRTRKITEEIERLERKYDLNG